MRVGIAHHLGWPWRSPRRPTTGSWTPIHHEGKPRRRRRHGARRPGAGSAARATSASLDALASAVPEPIVSLSLRAWPLDFPDEIAVLRHAPFEARADSVMYRRILDDLARVRGRAVRFYDARTVEHGAARILAARAEEILHRPRATLGRPGRATPMALAATVLAS